MAFQCERCRPRTAYVIKGEPGLCRPADCNGMAQKIDALYGAALAAQGYCHGTPELLAALDDIFRRVDDALTLWAGSVERAD